MTQHVSPLTSLSCCQCTCGGAESLTRDKGFGSLLDSLTTTPFSSGSRSGSGGMGVGDWFGFMDPLANFQLKQMLQDLRASVDLERRLKARVQEATDAADPAKGAPNRFADAAKEEDNAAPAKPATPAAPAAAVRPRDDAPRKTVEIKQHGHEPRKPNRTSTASMPPPAAAPTSPRPAVAPKAGGSEPNHSHCHASAVCPNP